MAGIVPVPSTRVSDSLIRQRMLSQLQSDQHALFLVQNALSTGRRFSLASEDAPAALRAVSLQRLLERKTQAHTNLATNQSYLSATDAAIQGVSGLLTQVKAAALSVAGSTADDGQRAAAAAEVRRALQQIVDAGNQRFRGRYLFAGANLTSPPYAVEPGRVVYGGDELSMQSYADTDLLFETNVTGQRAFGGISAAVRGAADLTPVLHETTRLSDLRGGAGIVPGSVRVSDGTNSRTVDLSSAATIADVARLLEANPPAGRTLVATVTPTGLTLQLDAAGGGSLTVSEVGGGTTAEQLGILHTSPGTLGPIGGGDLNPRLQLTTRLADLLGTRASARLVSQGPDNDLLLEARENGAQYNGVRIQLVDDDALQAGPGLTAGNETATFTQTGIAAQAVLALPGASNDLVLTAATTGTAFNGVAIDIVSGGNIGNAASVAYNASTKRLTLTIDDSDETTVATLINAINAEGTFTAARDATAETNVSGGVVPTSFAGAGRGLTRNTGADANTLYVRIAHGRTSAAQLAAAINAQGMFQARLDPSEANNSGDGLIQDSYADPAAQAQTAGGGGRVFDQDSGVLVRNGGASFEVRFSGAETVEDVLNILNGAGAGLAAQINAAGTGIDVRSRYSGTDFSVGELGGTTATELGIRSFDGQTQLALANRGRGVHTRDGDDFLIRRRDGVEFGVDVDGAVTVQDVLDRINNHSVNQAAGEPLLRAQLARTGNGIELVQDGPGGTQAIRVSRANLSEAAWDLGLIPSGQESATTTAAGATATAALTPAGADNDLVFSATDVGAHVNGVVVRFIDSGAGAGNESVVYNAALGTLTFDIDAATTTAADVVAVLAADATAAPLFTAGVAAGNSGTGLVGLSATATLAGGQSETLTGTDFNPQETAGVFTGLLRLLEGLENNDLRLIQQGTELLDDSLLQINFARAELGARQQSLDVLQQRLDTEDTELRSALSLEIDTDLVQAASDLAARQAALEASLRAASQTLRLSLLDFL